MPMTFDFFLHCLFIPFSIFIITYNAEYWCEIENNYYMLVELEDRDSTMKKEIDNNKVIEKKKYIPPSNHPWRKNMMLK